MRERVYQYIYTDVYVFAYVYVYVHVSVVPHKAVGEVSHGWQSEPTDGLKGGWSCVFWSGCNGCSGHLVGHLTHNCWM